MTLRTELHQVDRQPPPPETFFHPRFTEVCPRLITGPDTESRLYQEDSLDWNTVVRATTPNSLALYNTNADIYRVNHANHHVTATRDNQSHTFATSRTTDHGEVLQQFFPHVLRNLGIRGGYIGPVGPWGNRFALVHLDFGKEVAPAVVDLPPHILRRVLKDQARIMDLLLPYGPVYWGVNNSAGCIDGKGLMSVLYAHSQLWQFSENINTLTPDSIRQTRSEQPWDGGASEAIGHQVKADMQQYIKQSYWRDADFQVDRMGFTIRLPGFRPDHFANLNFIDKFWAPLSWDIHEKLQQIHEAAYGTKLNDIITYVQDSHFRPFNRKKYEGFFANPRPARQGSDMIAIATQRIEALRAQHIERRPISWNGGIQVNENGATVAVSFGMLNISMGPVESMAVKLDRPKQRSPQDEMNRKNIFLHHIVDQALAA